jgi:HAD superfamily hydrolase (TIGR01509 family)
MLNFLRYKAILWDCDGVLIDSEILACTASVDVLREEGVDITLQEYIERFLGKNRPQILAEIGFSGTFPTEKHKARKKFLFDSQLKPIPGIHDVLSSLSLPMAIASGSDPERLQYTLGLTNLLKYFKEHVYSSESVKNGKPAPDIFLYAAEKLRVAPADCLVIEDSSHGVAAAKAAGMDVYAFTGGSHMTENLRNKLVAAKPNAIFDDMSIFLKTTKVA